MADGLVNGQVQTKQWNLSLVLARRSGEVWHRETNGIPADYLCDDNLALVGKECCSKLVGKNEREQVAHAPHAVDNTCQK